ncbi:hypothetical protein ACJJTC_008972 [Scirpophaga incertulas]
MGFGQSKEEKNLAVAQAQAISNNVKVESKLEYLSIFVLVTVILLVCIILCFLRHQCLKSTKAWLKKQAIINTGQEYPVIKPQRQWYLSRSRTRCRRRSPGKVRKAAAGKARARSSQAAVVYAASSAQPWHMTAVTVTVTSAAAAVVPEPQPHAVPAPQPREGEEGGGGEGARPQLAGGRGVRRVERAALAHDSCHRHCDVSRSGSGT